MADARPAAMASDAASSGAAAQPGSAASGVGSVPTAAPALTCARSELILGGQRSGKSRRAEMLARHWLQQGGRRRALMVATAQPGDAEMRARIARHQQDRALRVPGMATLEVPLALAEALLEYDHPEQLIVVDCLTLWLTNWRMPAPVPAPLGALGQPLSTVPPIDAPQASPRTPQDVPQDALQTSTRAPQDAALASAPPLDDAPVAALLQALTQLRGPIVLVGNEIGLGVIPMGAQVRAFVDALGHLNQQVAQQCARVTLMAAGLPLVLKDAPAP